MTGTLINVAAVLAGSGIGLALGARLPERLRAMTQSAVGFLAASLLYCVGPMTILGSFQDGLSGDFSLLATKSALDGVSSVVLAASLGFGVLLSAATVLIYQGSLTLAAEALRPLLSDAMVREMSAVGGLIIVALGLGLLQVRKVGTGHFPPAIAVAPLAAALLERV